MADKRISQLVDRGTIANNDVVPIVVSGATTTNKATISSIQTFMQGNLDLGVTSVGITLGSSGTDVSVSGSPITSSGNITINIPTASATNRGLLSAADWSTFNSKQQAITLTTTGTSGAATLVSGTLNIPNYSTDLSGYVTLGTTQTITAQKTFTTSGSSDTMIISHGSGSGFALDVLKAGSGEAIRVTKTSGSGNAMTISGGNFEAGTIVKTGGTSSQFLKADGSVDSSSYALNSSLSLYLPLTGGTISGQLNVGSGNLRIAAEGASNITILRNFTGSAQGQSGFNNIGFNNSNNFYFTKNLNNGAIFSFSNTAYQTYTLQDASGTLAFTSDIPSLAGYVTLATTQTITGAKTFDTTTSNFLILNSTNASGGALTFRRNGTNVGHIGNSGVLGVGILDDLEVRSGIGKGLHLKTDGGKLTLSSGGSVTLDGALNGTSATFSGDINPTSNNSSLVWSGSGNKVSLNANNGILDFYVGTSSYFKAFTLASTGAATFSSSVTAASGVIESGGLNIKGTGGIAKPDYLKLSNASAGAFFWDIWRDNTTGNLNFGSAGGGAVSNYITMQSSGGLSFNGDTAAANALDDYEEGTWTANDASGAGLSFTVVDARYTKIGRQVQCFASITYPTTVNTNNAIIGGLPFTSAATTGGSYGAFTAYSNNGTNVFFLNIANTSTTEIASLSGSNISNATLSGKQFRLVWIYEV
jgi:hypothetical protein